SRKGVYSFEVRDSATGELRRSFTEPGRYFTSMDIHPLTDEIFTGGWQKMVWQGESPAYFTLPTSHSRTGVFLGTGEWFIGPDDQAGLALMQMGKGQPGVIRKFPRQKVPVTGSDGKYALLEGGQGLQLLRNVGTGSDLVATIPEEKRQHKFLKDTLFTSTRHIPGPRFDRVLATDDSMSVIRDAKTGRSIVDLEPAEKAGAGRFSVGDLAWFDQGRKIIGIGNRPARNGKNQSSLVVWDAITGKIIQTAAAATELDTLAVSPDDTRLASAGTDMTIRVHDTSTLQFLYGFRAHNAAISNLAWHPKQQVLASASEDLTVKIWDLRADKCVQILRTLDSRPTALSFSPGGKMITCSDEKYVRVWALDIFK
ncbi:MAG: WD40 repeat domain-containing protein, partial [Verrucomicrobiales bacterium]|nr:WD40 repeat domain-containing protein [Verrucomicrobiales bacterium]